MVIKGTVCPSVDVVTTVRRLCSLSLPPGALLSTHHPLTHSKLFAEGLLCSRNRRSLERASEPSRGLGYVKTKTCTLEVRPSREEGKQTIKTPRGSQMLMTEE